MSPAVLKPTISADKCLQTYALDHAATGTGSSQTYRKYYVTRDFEGIISYIFTSMEPHFLTAAAPVHCGV